jgi:hypothetical protein
VCLYFFYPERASACYTICEPITGIFPNEYVKKEDVTMLTRDVVAFLLCLLGAVLGPYTLALVKENPSLLQMLATLVSLVAHSFSIIIPLTMWRRRFYPFYIMVSSLAPLCSFPTKKIVPIPSHSLV